MAFTQIQCNISQRSDSMARNDWATIRRMFQRFTAPETASEILRTCLPGLSESASEISECTILDAKLKKYLKPTSLIKSTLSVCYQLTVCKTSADTAVSHIFYAKVFLGGRSTDAFRRLAHGKEHDPEFQQGVTHVPEHDMILWRFPHDPVLPHLDQLADTKTVGELLPLAELTQLGISEGPHVLSSHVVNYRPEIRCVNRYDLYDPEQDRTYQIFGKTFRGGEGRAIHERLNYFRDRALKATGHMTVARPLGYTETVDTVWQLGVQGTPLLQVLDMSNYEQHVAAVAKGLASLHTGGIADLATHSPSDHITEVRKKLVKLADAVPHLAPTCESLADQLERTAPQVSEIPFHPIHWDFHIDQLIVNQGKLVFCDLDELVIGDPVQDLANFMVDLHFRNLNTQLVRLMTAKLYDDYRQQVEWDVPIERLAWHRRLQFINKAYRYYLRFAPDFERTVERIMRMAEGEFSL